MTAERFRQIRQVFEAALDQPDAERKQWLAEACQGDGAMEIEVNELLGQHQKRSGLLDSPAFPAIDTPAASQPRMEGRRLGAWEILREIGRGGMG